MTFTQFHKLCGKSSLDAIDHGCGHWQIRGGVVLVNYYPEGKRGPTIYVNGGKRTGELDEVVDASE